MACGGNIAETRSQSQARFEDFVKETLKQLSDTMGNLDSKMQSQEEHITLLNMQNSQIMTELKGGGGAGNLGAGSPRSQETLAVG